MTPEEPFQAPRLPVPAPPLHGMNPDDLRAADAIEVVLGQGAKPGAGGGMLLGQKITERVAGMRTLPVGIDQRSSPGLDRSRRPRHQDPRTGITDFPGEVVIYVKVATRTGILPDTLKASVVHAGADAVASPTACRRKQRAQLQDVFIEHVGIPATLPPCPAVRALQELGVHRGAGPSSFTVSGGIRGADMTKALALVATAAYPASCS
ncbi:glutamate synthase-related protein [Streptomyces sp. L7]